MLLGLFRYQIDATGDAAKMVAQVDALEAKLKKYETAATEGLSDQVHQAVLILALPDSVADKFMMQ